MCKFSLVVPCYNSRENVDKLFKMLDSDKYADYEVIYVDDCSKDKTYEKMLELQNNYPKYYVYQTEKNGGPGPARNYGISRATGEYILFCDSDDEFDINCLTGISDFMDAHPDADMVVFPHEVIRGNQKTKNDTYPLYKDGEEMKVYDVARGCGGPVAKVYKRSIILENNIQFPDRMTGEDKCFLVYYSVHVKKAYKSDMIFYRYIMNRDSVTHQKRNDLDKPTTFELLQPIYHKYFPEIELEMYVGDHLLTRAKMMTANKCSAKEIREYFQKENEKYPHWIDKIDYENQSIYRKMIYSSMYNSRPHFIRLVMLLRRLVY